MSQGAVHDPVARDRAFLAEAQARGPLAALGAFLKLSGHKVDRDSLRTPFFAQCYLAGATSILVSVGSLGVNDPLIWTTLAGMAIVAAITVWYIAIQRLWLMAIPGMVQWKAWAWAFALYLMTTSLVVAANALVE